ncbi:MAG: hypothetical protein AAF267_04775, partial [Deinococcota bacterium]
MDDENFFEHPFDEYAKSRRAANLKRRNTKSKKRKVSRLFLIAAYIRSFLVYVCMLIAITGALTLMAFGAVVAR